MRQETYPIILKLPEHHEYKNIIVGLGFANSVPNREGGMLEPQHHGGVNIITALV